MCSHPDTSTWPMREKPAAIVLLGLGTNLGDREDNLRQALQRLRALLRVTALSRVYETPPWGVADQPHFLNACLAGETNLDAPSLLAACKQVERAMGREPAERWGPRLIDIDLLFYDNEILNMSGLTVPHPHLSQRAFVLRPLADIAPDFRHPVLGVTVAELLTRVSDSDMQRHPFSWTVAEGADG